MAYVPYYKIWFPRFSNHNKYKISSLKRKCITKHSLILDTFPGCPLTTGEDWQKAKKKKLTRLSALARVLRIPSTREPNSRRRCANTTSWGPSALSTIWYLRYLFSAILLMGKKNFETRKGFLTNIRLSLALSSAKKGIAPTDSAANSFTRIKRTL